MLIMPDFCVTPVVGSSQRFWSKISRYSIVTARNSLIIRHNFQNNENSSKRKKKTKLGDIQLFQLLVSQSFFVVIPGNGVYPGDGNSKGKNKETSEKHVKGISGNRALG